MNKRLLSVLVFALVVSAGASFIVYRLVSARITATAKQATKQVVTATRDLELGVLLKDLDLKMTDWIGDVPKGAFVKLEDVLGRGVISPIYQGEPVLDNRLAAPGAGAGLASIIPKGMRAVALRVNEVVGVAGFVTPGMRVDILIAGNPPNTRSSNLGTLTKTLLQNVEVLSAGQNIQKDAEGKPVTVQVVNLLVTPEDAEILSLASSETRIQLVLRNPIDTEEAKTPGTALAHLFSGQKGLGTAAVAKPPAARRPKPVVAPPPPQAAPPEQPQKITIPITVEVIHGSRRVQASFKEEKDVPAGATNSEGTGK